MSASFRQKYCDRFAVAPDSFERTLLRHALFPHVRLLVGAIDLLAPRCFALDRRVVADVGRARSRHDFYFALDDFRDDPTNHRFIRRVLRLRVSSTRLESIFYDVWSTSPALPVTCPPASI